MIPSIITSITARVPEVLRHLKGPALYMAVVGEAESVKYVGTFYSRLKELVLASYAGIMTLDEFFANMELTIEGELRQAVNQAYDESEVGVVPEVEAALSAMIDNEILYINNFWLDIVAGKRDGVSVLQFLARAQVWANRWNDAYNMAKLKIAALFGAKMEWVYGDAEHCVTCQNLNGIVAYAKEWDEAGVTPQSPPNSALECGGWRCQCTLTVTDKRKTPNAASAIAAALRG